MSKIVASVKSIVAKAGEVQKALVAAAAVAVTVSTTAGVPTDVKAIAASVAAVLATFGATYVVSNKKPVVAAPAPPAA